MAAHAATGLCDEVVALWRLATLNPALSLVQRNGLMSQLTHWQSQCIDRLRKAHVISCCCPTNSNSSTARRADWESSFLGFKPAIEACQLDWSDIALPAGVSELLRSRGPWSSAGLAPRSPVTPESVAAVDSMACDASHGDSYCVVRVKESRRKVLLPSERFHHPAVRPWTTTCASHKTDGDPSTSSYDSDAAARNDKDATKAAAACSGSADEQLCYELSKSLTAADRSSSETTKAESQSDVSRSFLIQLTV